MVTEESNKYALRARYIRRAFEQQGDSKEASRCVWHLYAHFQQQQQCMPMGLDKAAPTVEYSST